MTDSATTVAPPQVLTCNRRHMLQLARALEDGTHQQGIGFLRREDGLAFVPGEPVPSNYCCAGVACNVRQLTGGGGRWFRPPYADIPQSFTFIDLPLGQEPTEEQMEVRDELRPSSVTVLTAGTIAWLGLVAGEAPPTGWVLTNGDQVVALPVYVPERVFVNEDTSIADEYESSQVFGVGWHPAVNMNDAGVPFATIARCLRFTYLRPDTVRQEKRRAELARLTKPVLAAMYRNSGYYLASAHPLESWNKGELVSAIIEGEFYDGWQNGNYTPASQA